MINAENKEEVLNDLVTLRRNLHRFPEVSNQEFQTADRVIEFVLKTNPSEVIDKVGGGSVLAIYRCEDPNAKTAVVRCELDALPIRKSMTSVITLRLMAYHTNVVMMVTWQWSQD